jgi:hypothetical protein
MLDPTGHDIPTAAELVEDEVARIRERARQDRAERWSAVLAWLGWRSRA